MKWGESGEGTDLSERGGEGLVGAVESGPELRADALGQFGGAQALDGVLRDLALPLGRDGRRIDPRDAVDDLRRHERQPPHQTRQRRALWVTHLFDLLPEEPGDGGARVEGHLHVIRRVQDLTTITIKTLRFTVYNLTTVSYCVTV